MPILKDYINSLVSSITDARVSADMQTAKVAETYLNNSVLRHFSVPRIRIGDVEMNVPVALSDASSDKNLLIYTKLCEGFGVPESKIPDELSNRLKERISSGLDALKNGEDSYKISEDLAYFAQKSFKELGFPIDHIDPEYIIRKVNEILNSSVGELNVIVDAGGLKDLGSQSIMQIKLKVYEEGMEWSISENSKGEVETRLIPE